MLKIDSVRNHLSGITLISYLVSPIDNIWNFPYVSTIPVLTISLLIASLGKMLIIKTFVLCLIFFWLGTLGLMGLSFYAFKSALAISFFLVLFYKDFSLDGQLIHKYLKTICITFFSLIIVSIINNPNLYLDFLKQLNLLFFLNKGIDAYIVNSAIKFQWIFGDAKAAQNIFTGITLFLPFFLWMMLSFYMKNQRLFTVIICFIPFLVLFSRSAVVFLLIYIFAKKEAYRAFVLSGAIISSLIFYYLAYTHFPELLRGRNIIIQHIFSHEINLFFGSGPGFWQGSLENEAGQGSLHNIYLEWFLAYGVIGSMFTVLLIILCYFKNKSPSLLLGLNFLISFGLFNFNIAEIAFLGVGALITKIDPTRKENKTIKIQDREQFSDSAKNYA